MQWPGESRHANGDCTNRNRNHPLRDFAAGIARSGDVCYDSRRRRTAY